MTTRTTTTRPAKKAAAPKRRVVKAPAKTTTTGPEPDIVALDLDAYPQGPVNVDTVHLFTLDQVEYHIPAKLPTNLTLKFLRMARRDGEIQAGGWLLEEVLGEDAYTALMDWDGLTDDILDQLVGIVNRIAMGSANGATRPLGR